ncbi:hypothetical protein ID866_4886 [Astraeus odoratus]|nr:hypothetical protein ID866_4886 [Astraeus odoratus]
MQTRSQSSVLGKRTHQTDGRSASVVSTVESVSSQAMPTPELTPKAKRARLSLSLLDGDSNKENVPPFRTEPAATSPSSPSTSLRRTSTEIITPSRTRSTVGRHASTSSIQTLPITPATSLSALALSTPPPTPHASLLPIHARARALLRATCNGNSTIAGRLVERETIKNFICSSWGDHSADPSLFISGTPGTGKTALVNAVLAELGEEYDVEIVSVNCMAYQNAETLWDHLRDVLAPAASIKASPRKGKAKGKPLLEDMLASRKRKCLLVLDELDHIASSCQSLAAVFSLARKYSTVLRIIGIANTHTLTASTNLLGDEAARLSTLHFGGYTSSQLLDVLNARLAPLHGSTEDVDAKKYTQKFLPTPTLTLLAKKVASQTGDVRMLFGVLRGAIDMAVSSSCPAADENPLAAPVPTVTPNHVLSALKAYLPSNDAVRGSTASSSIPSVSSPSNSEIATKVRGLGLQARLVLLSILLAVKRMEALLPLSYSLSSPPKTPVKRAGSSMLANKPTGLDLAQLHTYYAAVLERADHGVFTPVSRSEFADLIGILETSGLVSSSTSCSSIGSPSKSGRRGFGRSTSFGAMAKGAAAGQDIRIADAVRTDEILRGLGVVELHAEIADPREEEVRAIWARENARIAKDVKARVQSKRDTDVIEGAFEH